MSDSNSSLPVRTETTGDLISELAGATGITITSTTISLKEALDVNVANTITASNPSVSDNALPAPAFSTQAGGLVSTAAPTYASGDLDPLSLTLAGALRVDGSGSTQPVSGTVTANQGTSPWVTSVNNLPATVDTNYGTVGASTLRSASQIGNATGAANFNAGATGTQTLRVEANQGAANATPWNENIAQIAGSAPSASNALPVQLSVGAAFISPTNPVPVYMASEGSPVNDLKSASAIGAGASDNHDYTVTALKTLYLNQVESSGSGKAKMLIAVETGVATGVFTSRFVQFNSTAETNMNIQLKNPIAVAAGVRVRVTMSNRDLLAQDLYSTICGYEI